MDVTVLGTGSPNEMRATTGLVVRAPGCAPLLIDTCGGFELPRQLATAGIPIADLRQVVLTHRHLDHIGGMPALFIEGRPLTIYAQADTHEAVAALMLAGFPEWPVNPQIRHVTIVPRERREIGGFSVEFFAVQHRVPTVAVRVEQDGRALAFSADSVPCDALLACAREADLFLCDALYAAGDGEHLVERARRLMHPTGREAGEMATAAGARALTLLHLGSRSTPERIFEDARATYTGPLRIAEDCETYRV